VPCPVQRGTAAERGKNFCSDAVCWRRGRSGLSLSAVRKAVGFPLEKALRRALGKRRGKENGAEGHRVRGKLAKFHGTDKKRRIRNA